MIAMAMGLVAAALVIAPMWTEVHGRGPTGLLIALGMGLAATGWFVRPRWIPLMAMAGMAIGLLMLMPLMGASDNWLQIGFGYGMRHFRQMKMGPISNLAAILESSFGVRDPESVAFTVGSETMSFWPGTPLDVSWRQLLSGIYLALTALSCWAMAVHDRNNNRRFLIAASAPLVLFIALPTQIHERYPLYAAAASSVLIVCGIGPLLLHGLVSVFAGLTIYHALLSSGSRGSFLDGRGSDQFQALEPLHPGLGYGLIMLSLMFMGAAMVFRRPGRENQPPATPSAPTSFVP